VNVLLSYGIWAGKPLAETMAELFGDDRTTWPTLMVDSGAVQARNLGTEITPSDYADWLTADADAWQYAINLDVIFDPVASEQNHDELAKLGVETLPVFHGGEPWSYLQEMADRYDYLALGGMVHAGSKSGTEPWIARCFQLTAGRAVLHGLGMTRVGLLLAAPWRSVDSSSWGSGHRYGVLTVWTGRELLRAKKDQPRRYPEAVRLVRDAGFDPNELGDYKYVAMVNAYAWLAFEQAVQRHRPDFKMYLVDGAPFAMKAVAEASKILAGRGKDETR